jgi:hypothetical protein
LGREEARGGKGKEEGRRGEEVGQGARSLITREDK